MSKKVYIGESNLMDIKNAMASNNVSHSTFMSENTPPYEKDEFEIGGEGGNNDFFHVNEELSQDLIKFALEQRPDKYSTWAVINPDAPSQIPFYAEKKSRAIEFKRWYGKGVIVNLSKYENLNETYGYSKTVDFSEVGKVEYQWDYFEDDYQEWLQEEGLQDSPEVKMEYIKDNVTFDVDFLDNQTYHVMGSEGGLFYDDLENVFGESMAERMLNDCIENGSGSFETYEMYENESYDINNPQELNDIAMKLLPHGEYYKNCRGFILTNGVIVYTEGEHNDVLMIPGINNKFQFVELGNIRILDHSIDIGAEPTYEQEEVLRQILREYDGEEIYLDIFHDGEDIGVVYHSADYRYVMGEIDRFYSEGIRPQGGYTYENKTFCQETINENTFENWFGNSILKDENGEPIKMYHGTDSQFSSFSKDFIGKTGAFEGYGFNFTPYHSTAAHYNSKNVIEAYLRVENPMTTKSNKITLRKLCKIIEQLDKGKPYTDTIVAAYEPTNYGEKWDEIYYRRALPVAARKIYEYNRENDYGDAGIYSEISLNGQADAKDVISLFESFGYDSVIHYDNYGKIKTVVVFEPNQIKLAGNKTFSVDSDVMSENIETEVEASEVKLDSFKKNDTLAPRIWDGFDLNPRARLKLLDIADDFWDFVNITWVKRKGIHLTGSICNFNWSKFSDIDLHLVVDFSEIDERKDFVQEYFDAKKNEWNNEHSNLKIFGYPVELYVEDVNAETTSGGLYDLEENDWIKKPSPNGIKSIGLDKYEIKNKSADLMTKIDDLYDEFKATNDDAELREIGRKAHKLRDKIKKMRKFGLDRGGESDSFNIIYKVLRRAGYMDMLWDLSSELYDKLNSIDEIKDDKTAGIILEYLESNHNLPLYKYFEWAKNATDEDKAKDLMYQCSDTAVKYLETRNACMCDDLAKLRIEFRKNNDVIYDEEFVDAFGKGIAKNGLLRDLDFFMRYHGDFYELPSWMTMYFNRIVKNEWCIHFCFDAYSIAREGFKWGTDDIGRLALTGAGLKKPAEGYNFAFPIGERHIDRNTYGSINPVTRERGSQEAVIFQTSGVEVYHEGDEQNQVVFWGPNAKNFIPIKYDREVGDWRIYGNKGQVLKSGSPSEILNWVLENLPQYRKQIMVGKNGVNLKETIDYFDLARERFGVTYDIRECGYILPDGSMLDFSGRHMITGDTDSSHLKGRRSVDHRDISDLNWDKELKNRTNTNINMSDFIKKGAIRIHCSNTWSSINLFVKPTKEQINPLLRLIQYSKGNVTVEIGDGDNSYEYAEWDEANPRRVINDVIRYFDGETTNLVGNVTENKVITAYFNKYINLNEEIVADGNPDHNPFRQRWKHEREVLKDYIVNYGEIMTSKENGKEYKVLYDTMLSSRLGINYCICIQWDSMTMEPGNVIYVRAFDKFTRRRFKPEFDTRGRDNLEGTYDDLA